MSKRGPTSELNHDNWDDEDPSDEDKNALGGFVKATPEQLESRVFKVAKRRSVNTGTPTNSPFSAFTGFGAKPVVGDIPKPNFSFLSNASPALNNGHKENAPAELKKDSPILVPKEDSRTLNQKRTRVEAPNPTESSQKSPDYFAHLKSLNISVSKWVSKHVEQNPYCILTPVFTDYAKHLASLEKMKQSSDTTESAGIPEKVAPKPVAEKKEIVKDNKTSTQVKEDKPEIKKLEPVTPLASTDDIADESPKTIIDSPATSTSSSVSIPSLKVSSDSETPNVTSEVEASPPISNLLFETPTGGNITSPSIFQTPAVSTSPSVFGSLKTSSGSLFGSSKTTTEASKTGFNPSALTFTFGSSSTVNTNNATFQFGSSNATATSGFSFAGLAAKAAEQLQQPEVEEPEEPPKVDFTPVQEEGSEYEIRCKVFIKKDDEYKERGIGMLYLKPGEKTQLLVRTATTTGQILLNTLVTSSLMPTRVGKNNVQIVCIPTPSEKPPPAIMLIRVKTSEEADELLSKIKDHTK